MLTDQDISAIVEQKLAADSFRVLDWSLHPVGARNGFLGQYFSLSITIKVDGKLTTLKFFAKTPPPQGQLQCDLVLNHDMFNKEISAYSGMFKLAGKSSIVKWQPEFYLGKSNTILVLEDAKLNGYVTLDKYVPLDVEHCVWALKALSAFHSRSLILDEKLRRDDGRTVMDLYGHLVKEVLFIQGDEKSQKMLFSCFTGACTLVDVTDGLDPEQKTLVKDRIRRWTSKMPVLLDSSTKYRNVICHRDVWLNNMMFKREHTGKPSGCYFVDYQFMRFCPPAYDVLFVMHLITDRATRDAHLDAVLKIYYENLKQELANADLDIEDCLPWTEFLKSCEYARNVALVYTVLNLHIMLTTPEAYELFFERNVDQLDSVIYGDKRSELVLYQCRTKPVYKSRCTETVLEIKDRLPDHPPSF